MAGLSLARLAAVAVGLSSSLSAGAGVGSALPDLEPVIKTTCNYSQVVSALNAQDPVAAAGFNGSPISQMYLRGFLASSPDQRQNALQDAQNNPQAHPYVEQYAPLVLQVATTCHNY